MLKKELVVHACNPWIYGGIETRSKEVEATDALVLFGIGQPRLELDIYKTLSASSQEANVAQLQWDITTLKMKYKFL